VHRDVKPENVRPAKSPRMLSAKEIALELGIHEKTALERMKEMRRKQIGGLWRVERVDFERWLRLQTVEPEELREWERDSSAAEISGTAGSRAARAGHARSRRIAPTRKQLELAPQSSNATPLIPSVRRRKRPRSAQPSSG